jgi:phosphate transport system protein
MTTAVLKMLGDSVEAFVTSDLDKVKTVMDYDDVIDTFFDKIRKEIIGHIEQTPADAAPCLDLLLAAKYLERIGDHAKNIAEWTDFSITGELKEQRIHAQELKL